MPEATAVCKNAIVQGKEKQKFTNKNTKEATNSALV